MIKALASLGYLDTFSGVLSATSFALIMADYPEESNKYHYSK